MAADSKRKMIESTARLLATRGLQSTSFTEVLDDAGAPRGSVYHHFPGGKEEMVAAALDLVGSRGLHFLEQQRGRPAREIAELFLAGWRDLLSRSNCRAGCAVLAVAVAADSKELLARTAGIFRTWRSSLAALFAAGGMLQRDAASFATTLIAATEGAVVLARAERSLEPFEAVAGTLLAQAASLSSPRRRSTTNRFVPEEP